MMILSEDGIPSDELVREGLENLDRRTQESYK